MRVQECALERLPTKNFIYFVLLSLSSYFSLDQHFFLLCYTIIVIAFQRCIHALFNMLCVSSLPSFNFNNNFFIFVIPMDLNALLTVLHEKLVLLSKKYSLATTCTFHFFFIRYTFDSNKNSCVQELSFEAFVCLNSFNINVEY